MKITMNEMTTFNSGIVGRVSYPLNGIRKDKITDYHNLFGNMGKFKQIEFLKGDLKIYLLVETSMSTSTTLRVNSGMMGYSTQRFWVDDQLEIQSELVIPKPGNVGDMWAVSSEIPGYGVRFIKTALNANINKYKFKSSKKDWRTLKANPTGFQVNLPLPEDDPVDTLYPKNIKLLHLDLVETADSNLTVYQVYTSHTVLVRFKGRTDL